MDLKDFIEKFAEQFEETEISSFSANTSFKELEEWSSLMSLAIIAMVDEEYGVRVKGDDIKDANTIEDLFKIACIIRIHCIINTFC